MISQKTIETIISTSRIEEVIGDFIHLKKRGVNFIGLCPFHDEKTPSFTVSPTKEIFKCFGCGKAGSTVTFLMEHEKYTYPQALIYLANKYHIEIEEDATSDEQKAEKDDLESIYIVLRYAQTFYENYLFNSEEGKTIGLAYFRERNFHPDTIKKFNLGFSPSSSDLFTQDALKNGYKEEYLIDAGLSIKTQDGKLIDRFRERVMFPIQSMSGRTLGFGARTLKKGSSESKYINSPETKVYTKSNVLYGLFQARQAISKAGYCYLVEGYTDVISLYQTGIENVVASLGTSLTENHVKIIKRLTFNLTFIYDGDEAGIKASFRGIDIGLKEGLFIKVVPLPETEDPDSFSKNNPKLEVQEYIRNNTEDFILFKSKLLFKNKNTDPIQKAEGIRNIIQSIIQIPSFINRTEYLKQLSKITKIDEETLNRELNNQLRNRVRKQLESPQVLKDNIETTLYPKQRDRLLETISGEQENKILQLLIEYGNQKYQKHSVASEIIEHIKDSEWENPLLKEMFDFYVQYYNENKTSPDLNIFLLHPNKYFNQIASEFITPLQNLSQNWHKRTSQSLQMEFNYIQEIKYCLKHFELRKYYSMKKQNLNDLKNPDLNPEEILRILNIDKELGKRINNISRELSVVYY